MYRTRDRATSGRDGHRCLPLGRRGTCGPSSACEDTLSAPWQQAEREPSALLTHAAGTRTGIHARYRPIRSEKNAGTSCGHALGSSMGHMRPMPIGFGPRGRIDPVFATKATPLDSPSAGHGRRLTARRTTRVPRALERSESRATTPPWPTMSSNSPRSAREVGRRRRQTNACPARSSQPPCAPSRWTLAKPLSSSIAPPKASIPNVHVDDGGPACGPVLQILGRELQLALLTRDGCSRLPARRGSASRTRTGQPLARSTCRHPVERPSLYSPVLSRCDNDGGQPFSTSRAGGKTLA